MVLWVSVIDIFCSYRPRITFGSPSLSRYSQLFPQEARTLRHCHEGLHLSIKKATTLSKEIITCICVYGKCVYVFVCQCIYAWVCVCVLWMNPKSNSKMVTFWSMRLECIYQVYQVSNELKSETIGVIRLAIILFYFQF